MDGAAGIERHDWGDDAGDRPIGRPAAAAPSPDEQLPANEPEPAPLTGRLLAATAVALSLTWIGGMLWWARARLALLAPEQAAGFVAALCVPPALLGIVWLLAMRTSRAEARRFGATARAMRAEGASLERAVARLSADVERGREHLDAQARALVLLGGSAADRVATLGDEMAGGVTRIVDHVERLGGATEIARGSLDLLLARLPQAQAEATAISHALAETGTSAMAHVAGLDARLVDLAEHGRQADATAERAARRLDEHAARIAAAAGTGAERLSTAATALAGQVEIVLARAAGAIEAQRHALAEHGERISALLAGAEAALAGRVAEIEQALAGVATRLDALHDEGAERTRLLAASIAAIGVSAEATTELLRVGEPVARQAIATGEDLLVALDAAAREIDETLPGALGRLDAHVAGTRGGIATVRPELLALVTMAESTRDTVAALSGEVAAIGHAADGAVETLAGRVRALHEAAAAAERHVDAAEAIDQEGFARRAALLTEALNSTGAELAKALSGEVSDNNWAAYLKGDRGVFTRRAVRLLDGGQARDLATRYAGDAGFHDHVDRYIHDFEAMLRDVLAHRNGEAMGVTLLSSDMGKLYVALAQAIERLR